MFKCLSALMLLLSVVALSAQKPRVFLMDADRLASLKTSYAQNDKDAAALVADLQKKADKLLSMKPVSVMDKAITPVSGTKHDYMSQAPYFWYDSSKPNGLPYMRRDGVRNPEINKIIDHKSLDDLENAVQTLSLAWYFTGNEKYAQKAAQLLRYWFLEDATKMNPNLNYSQGIPGITDGRGIGIIETRSLMNVADAIGLLRGSNAWTMADDQGLQQWYKEYLNWLLTSKNGNEEHRAKNNHGTWFNAQAVDYALFTGDMAKAHALAEEAKQRIDSQINGQGQMKLELERTAALSYSTFNLVAWSELATLAQKAGTDLWSYHNAAGSGIRKAIDWLRPFAVGDKKWEYQQINNYNKGEAYELLLYAAFNYKDNSYLADADRTGRKGTDLLLDMLLRR
ncbi:MAG: alginate lyase family protein [Chitinophagaceae bacterium]|nr:alginate lyase family protein [Chitinophagaceae bacterium]